MTCEEFDAVVYGGRIRTLGDLTVAERAATVGHLLACPGCAERTVAEAVRFARELDPLDVVRTLGRVSLQFQSDVRDPEFREVVESAARR